MPKMCVTLLFVVFAFLASSFAPSRSLGEQNLGALRSNNCVLCHSRIQSPVLSGRYLEWHVSPHRAAGVGCNKCHGGDPAEPDSHKAHNGILPPSNKGSRLHLINLPETCGACHSSIVNAFTESTHYERLKSSGFAPSCTTCHAHMASSVARYPSEGAALCAHCHNTVNGILAPRPEIPNKAKVTLAAIFRTNHMVTWLNGLLREAEDKKLDVAGEKEEMRLLKGLLVEAKVGWHAFKLDGPQVKADKGFEEGVRIRERLAKKLGHD